MNSSRGLGTIHYKGDCSLTDVIACSHTFGLSKYFSVVSMQTQTLSLWLRVEYFGNLSVTNIKSCTEKMISLFNFR